MAWSSSSTIVHFKKIYWISLFTNQQRIPGNIQNYHPLLSCTWVSFLVLSPIKILLSILNQCHLILGWKSLMISQFILTAQKCYCEGSSQKWMPSSNDRIPYDNTSWCNRCRYLLSLTLPNDLARCFLVRLDRPFVKYICLIKFSVPCTYGLGSIPSQAPLDWTRHSHRENRGLATIFGLCYLCCGSMKITISQ